jgi:hypothetical protein
MKAIQTYLSPQHVLNMAEEYWWTSEKYRCYSFALSCMQLVKFHPDVTLVTDKQGKALLIDTFGLPYHHVQVVLDDVVNELPVVTDGLAKVFSWSLAKEHFLFVDETVYAWNALDLTKFNSDFFVFHADRDNDEILRGIIALQKFFQHVPAQILNDGKPRHSISTRVVGGAPQIFKNYYTFLKTFISDTSTNKGAWNKLISGEIDPLFLNYFTAEFYKQSGVSVDTIHSFARDDRQFTPFTVFEPSQPHSLSYIPNGLKSDFNTESNLSFLVETLYPEIHKRISTYFNAGKMVSTEKTSQSWTPVTSTDFFVRTLKALNVVSTKFTADDLTSEQLSLAISDRISALPESADKKLVTDVFDFEKAKYDFRNSLGDVTWTAQYKKRMNDYRTLFLTREANVIEHKFICSKTIRVVESLWKWGIHTNVEALYPLRVVYNYAMPEGYFQTLLWFNSELNGIAEYDLEQLDMVMLEAFRNPSSLEEAFDRMSDYFEEGRAGVEQVKPVAMARFKELVFMGALSVTT